MGLFFFSQVELSISVQCPCGLGVFEYFSCSRISRQKQGRTLHQFMCCGRMSLLVEFGVLHRPRRARDGPGTCSFIPLTRSILTESSPQVFTQMILHGVLLLPQYFW